MQTLKKLLAETKESIYFASRKVSSQPEWILNITSKGYLGKINIMPNNHNGDLTMSGISYWNNKDGDTIKEKILELINQNCFQNQFWDNIILSNLNLFSIKVIEISDIYEIDTIEDIIHINNNILDQK